VLIIIIDGFDAHWTVIRLTFNDWKLSYLVFNTT